MKSTQEQQARTSSIERRHFLTQAATITLGATLGVTTMRSQANPGAESIKPCDVQAGELSSGQKVVADEDGIYHGNGNMVIVTGTVQGEGGNTGKIHGTMYEKVNGQWVETTITFLTDDITLGTGGVIPSQTSGYPSASGGGTWPDLGTEVAFCLHWLRKNGSTYADTGIKGFSQTKTLVEAPD